MKTLIIHPTDKTTDFLIPIYSGIKEATVIRGGLTRDEVNKQIEQHDRIMMMGHGSPSGLFAVGQFSGAYGYVINYETVSLLRNKECIFIWCNADRFVEAYNLKGLYSGMFISEVGEAIVCGLQGTPQSVVTESNDFFANEFGKVSNESLAVAYEYIKDTYGVLAESNSVAKYNHYRLYLNN
jgi:hypothetical protein